MGSIFCRVPSSADVVEVSEEVVKVVVKVFEMLARSQFSAELRAGLVVAPPSAVLLRPTMEEKKLLENLIKLICMDWTGRWMVLDLPFLFIHFLFSNEITRNFCEALRPLSEVFLKTGKVSVDRKYNKGPIC